MGTYAGGRFHAHTYWCPNLPHAACCNTASASQTNGKHSMTARLLYVFLACRLSVICFILLLFLRGGVGGWGGTGILVYSSTFYTIKPNSSSHCYIQRNDVVHCWNAASSQVKISMLERANTGSCVLLNPVALCEAGGTLSGSAYTTEQGRAGPIRWPWSQIVWQTARLCYWWIAPQRVLSLEPYLGIIWETAGLHGLKQRLASELASSTEDGKSVPSPCPPHLFY